MYSTMNADSKIDKEVFKDLVKKAVKSYVLNLLNEEKQSHIYGLAFEITGIVDTSWCYHNNLCMRWCSEELYKEHRYTEQDDSTEENLYYRYDAWSNWVVSMYENDESYELAKYLWINRLPDEDEFGDAYPEDEETPELAEWFDELDYGCYEYEVKQIRYYMAEALGELRKEGFFTEVCENDLIVIPYEGEGEIEPQEVRETFELMDCGTHKDSTYYLYLEVEK